MSCHRRVFFAQIKSILGLRVILGVGVGIVFSALKRERVTVERVPTLPSPDSERFNAWGVWIACVYDAILDFFFLSWFGACLLAC